MLRSSASSSLPGVAGFPSPTPESSLRPMETPWGSSEYTSTFWGILVWAKDKSHFTEHQPIECWFHLCVSSLHGKSSSTGNLLEREDMALSTPDYGMHSRMAAQSAATLHGRQQRPYSVAVPGFSQVGRLGKHTNTHTNTPASSHTWFHKWHMSRAVKQNLAKICARLSRKVLTWLFSTCCWPEIQCRISFALTGCLFLYKYSEFSWAKACRERSATLAYINAEISSPSLHTFLFMEGRVWDAARLRLEKSSSAPGCLCLWGKLFWQASVDNRASVRPADWTKEEAAVLTREGVTSFKRQSQK